ncbi:MAG: hypothetical protein H6Q33_1432 [Deltaproteobacteria bacterium]|nr:hypothetical protein [Deltaproteobacteria bacterium]
MSKYASERRDATGSLRMKARPVRQLSTWMPDRRQVFFHFLVWFLAWPLFAVLMAAVTIRRDPLTSAVPLPIALSASVLGLAEMWPEFGASGLAMLGISIAVFAPTGGGRRPAIVCLLEPILVFGAVTVGIAMEFPAVLSHPSLALLRHQKVLLIQILLPVLLLLAGFLLGWVARPRIGMGFYPLAVAGLVIWGWGLAVLPMPGVVGQVGSRGVVLVGLDSLSTTDDVTALRELTRDHSGTFYENAITPGLLTNAVWPAILMHRPVRETGVLLTYQAVDWTGSQYQLIGEAKRRGYETWSYFGDQFTTYVGTTAGFEHNRSGPLGWLQLSTSTVKNASVLLPMLMSRLPEVAFWHTPRNQANTYSYDLRAELREILTRTQAQRPTFVAAQLDYLHQAAYPRMSELSADERSSLRLSPLVAVQDLSLNWQYPKVEGDVIGIYRWKIKNLERLVADVLRETDFLAPARQNRLVVFSDHGNRRELVSSNFGQRKYYTVVLATFGMPAGDAQAPISLLDLGPIAGFPDRSRPEPSEPAVEYYNMDDPREWIEAIGTATFATDGRVIYRPHIIARSRAKLRTYREFGALRGYSDAVVVGAEPGDRLR